MGSDKSPDYLRGFGLLLPNLEIAPTAASGVSSLLPSDITQQSPEPGAATSLSGDNGEPLLRLATSGDQLADTRYYLRTQSAGNPGYDGGAAFVWRDSPTGDYYGRDIQTASQFSLVSAIGSNSSYHNPDLLGLPNGDMICVYEAVASSGFNVVEVVKFSQSTGTWGTVVKLYDDIIQTAMGATCFFHPCIARADNGDLLICHWVYDVVNKYAQIQTWRSKDNGDNWYLISQRALYKTINASTTTGASAEGYLPGRLRMGITNGQVLLVGAMLANDTTDQSKYLRQQFAQFASNSMGGKFHTVAIRPITLTGFEWDTNSDVCPFVYHSVVIRDGKFHIPFPTQGIKYNPSGSGSYELTDDTQTLLMPVLGSAYDHLDSNVSGVVDDSRIANGVGTFGIEFAAGTQAARVIDISGDGTASITVTDGDGSAWVDESGVIYWVGRITDPGDETASDNALFMMRSDNSYGGANGKGLGVGAVFEYVGGGALAITHALGAEIFRVDGTLQYAKDVTGCSAAGRQFIAHNSTGTGTTVLKNLAGSFLGGYTTVLTEALTTFPNENERAKWNDHLMSPFTPSALSWTETTTGTGTITVEDNNLLFSYDAAGTAFIEKEYSAATVSMAVRICLEATAGAGNTRHNYRSLEIQVSDYSSDAHGFVINIEDDNLRFIDLHNASDYTDFSYTAGNALDIIVAVNMSGKGQAFIRQGTAAELRKPNRAFGVSDKVTMNLAAKGSASTSYIKFGGWTSPTTAHLTKLYDLRVRTGTVAAPELTSATYPTTDELHGRPYSARGNTTYLSDGLHITAVDGAARRGDEYSIINRYRYPAKNLQWEYSTSPRSEWRSNEVNPRWTTVPTQELVYPMGKGGTVAMNQFIDSDLMFFTLRNFNGDRFSIHYYNGSWNLISNVNNSLSTNAILRGDRIQVAGGSDNTGPFISENELAGWTCKMVSSGSEPDAYYRITGNTSGVFAGSAVSKRPVITIEGHKATDDTNYSGTLYIRPNNVTVVADVSNLGSDSWQAVRLTLTTTPTPDDCFRLGGFYMGRVYVPGKQYARGRVRTYQANTPSVISDDGTLRARKMGPGGESLRIAWTDGIDTTTLQGSTTSPDFFTGYDSSTGRIAAVNDVAESMIGIAKEIGEGLYPFVYLPAIEHGAAANRVFIFNKDQMLMTATSPVEIENVLGDEDVDELVRVASFTAREIR